MDFWDFSEQRIRVYDGGMLTPLSEAIGLGFVAAALPGPLQAFAMIQSLQRGFRSGLWVVPAPLVSDGPILVVCLSVLSRAPEGLLRILALGGGLFLTYLAATTWRQLRMPPGSRRQAEPLSGLRILGKASVINGLGPGPWIFWTTVTGPLLVDAWHESVGQALVFLAGFFGTFAATLATQVALFSFAGQLGTRIVRGGSWLGWSLLIAFAGSLLWAAAFGPA